MSRTIAHYEILEKIGEGGMGEVYKARDTKLDRLVALKILPPHLVEDAERLRRFVLEARSASALNHPNIVTIYEIGEASDCESGVALSSETPDRDDEVQAKGQRPGREIHYIAMEFVNGRSLAAKIHGEKTDLKKLLQYLVQAAEGLAKAHSAGIIHRDLKPDNVMVSEDGYAKILDFGLAKLVEAGENTGPSHVGGQLEDAPTVVMDRTRPGIVMGTVGYMSPEQVQGKPIDHRSDIFAFGCILYEAASFRKPFHGDSIIDSLHKIIYSQPAPIAEFSPSAPAELQRMIRKCIAKDPDERYQSAKDIAIDLRALVMEIDSGSFVHAVGQGADTSAGIRTDPNLASRQTAVQPAAVDTGGNKIAYTGRAARVPPSRIGLATKVIAAAIAAALVTFGMLYLFIGMRHARSRLNPLFQNRRITKLTSSGKSSTAHVSPDGKYVAYVVSDQGKQSIWLRQVATSSNVPVVPPADVDYMGLAFSPDGNYIYYSAKEKGKTSHSLYQVAALGGMPKKVLDKVSGSISFSPDGKSFAFVRNDPSHTKSMLWVARADGTGEQEIAERDIPNQFLEPAWSPDGKVIACSVISFTGAVHAEVTTVPASGGAEKPLPTRPWDEINGIQWLPDGTALLMSALEVSAGPLRSQIWRISYPSGRVQPVTSDLNNYAGISITSDSSSLLTVEYVTVSNVWIVPVSGGGGGRQITSGSGKYSEVACANDGRIAYCSDAGGGEDIWIMDADGKNQKQLTSDAGVNAFPGISQDLRYFVFTSGRVPGAYNTWRAGLDGSNPTQLTTGQGDYFPALSPDGKWVYYTVVTTNERPRIWRAPADGGSAAPLIEVFTFLTQVSPDGKLLACGYNNTQDATAVNLALKLGIFSAEGGPPIKTIPMPAMGHPEPGQFRWARDGQSIVYLQRDGGASSLWSQSLNGGQPKQIANFGSDHIFDFDITADGKQFVCSRGTVTTDVILIKDTGNP